jgi:uncharacterized membrane protein
MRTPPIPAPLPPSSETETRQQAEATVAEHEQIVRNIAAVQEFTEREEQKITASQRVLERISQFIGQPWFFGLMVAVVVVWGVGNVLAHAAGFHEVDPAPFFWLQGVIGLMALLTTSVVLIRQNRLARLADQRSHLALKVTLLTEQKVAKLIDLIEELRRDLPNVKDRHDPDAAVLKRSMNPEGVLAALDEAPVADKPAGGVGDAEEEQG